MADDASRIGSEGAPRPTDPAPTSAGALDIAMAAEAHDPSPDSPARRLLEKQGRLVEAQIALACNERFRNRIKAARDAALATLALAVVAGAGWVIWDASRADGVVIEPFAVAPALAQQGLTGPVVANRLLGRIAAMQAATQSSRMRRSARGGGDELSVEIPQTGVSAGEIVRLLRRRFGHETVVTGELAADGAGGLTLNVYADGVPVALPEPPDARELEAAKVNGRAPPARPALDLLLDRGAEAVFARTEPYRYSAWLKSRQRGNEMVRLLRRLSTRGRPEERAWAVNALAVDARNEGRLQEALALAEEAARLNPDLPNAPSSMANAHALLGHDERELQGRLRGIAAERRSRDFSSPGGSVQALAGVRRLRGDYMGMLAAAEQAIGLAETDSDADDALGTKAIAQSWLHEISAARRTVASMSDPPGPGSRGRKNFSTIEQLTLEDWAALEAELRAPFADADEAALNARWLAIRYRPNLALAVAQQGRTAEAAALIASTPLDCYLCVRNRGRIAALAGDHRAADRWFAEAVRQGPSLPFAHSEWGQSKLARGDLDGAIRLFREAQERGPRWADPLKYEGDALARQGKHRAAIRRYRQAAERAPRWGALHLAWGRSLEGLGRGEQARAKYAQAARMDLSAADRGELARRLRETAA